MSIISFANAADYAEGGLWTIFKNILNANQKFGLFNKGGYPFYVDSSSYDNSLFSQNVGGYKIFDVAGSWLSSIKVGSLDTNYTNLTDAKVVHIQCSTNRNITDAPVEGGLLRPINKTRDAITGSVDYALSGTDKQKDFFDRAIKECQNDYSNFIFHYQNLLIPRVNITGSHFDISSERAGQMFIMTVYFKEVMDVAQAQPLENATPYSTNSTNSGNVETATPTTSQVKSLSKTV